MAWWWWVLLWVFLLIGSAGVFALLGLSLWRKARVLLRELGEAADRFGAVSEAADQVSEAVAEPAVFTTAARIRQDRFLARRRPPAATAAAAQRKRGSQKSRQSVR